MHSIYKIHGLDVTTSLVPIKTNLESTLIAAISVSQGSTEGLFINVYHVDINNALAVTQYNPDGLIKDMPQNYPALMDQTFLSRRPSTA